MGVAWDTLSCRAALTWSTRQSARWGEDGCRLGILDAARGIGWLLVGLVRIVTEWGSEVVDRVLGRARLVAQRLVGPGFPRPVEAVAAFGAHQGQDLPGVLSSLALRTTNRSMARVLDAFAAGEIVRGYPMRGTVFAVAAADHPRLVPGNNGAFRRSAIAGGQVVGLWKRAGSPGRRRFELDEFGPLSERTRTSLARRFSEFPFFAD